MTALTLPRLFGTDGMRAPFGDYPLDRPTVTALGYHLALRLREESRNSTKPLVVLGGDTRFSTPDLARWLSTGLRAGGATVRYLGMIPTPAIALLTQHHQAQCGIAVSASHNPYLDNGIKLLDPTGMKWDKEAEANLEIRMQDGTPAGLTDDDLPATEAADVQVYLDLLAGSLASDDLDGLKIVLDAANGAASAFAYDAFANHGASVHLLHAQPDGRNINRDCGSTHTESLAAAVREIGADLGIAFDGDGDRALIIDEQGQLRDGDAMLYLWAIDLQRRDRLSPPSIVATSMSNLGLEHSLANHGIDVVRCDVGDRAVVAEMVRGSIVLGGEQSGHLVYSPLATTGDGLLTGLQLAAIVRRGGKPVSRQLASFERFPQLLRNVRVDEKIPFDQLPEVIARADDARDHLRNRGRLVLRYSGTEPLVRIMLEGPDQDELEALADGLAGAFDPTSPSPRVIP
ncbi:MAG: phosphoglucosamine mutase [Thermoanaerobaculia bacterium]|nr:phosphoglucosamine mutase [Thermoanaerobaculia bacterium]